MKKRLIVRYISMAAAIAIMVIIFLFSAQNGENSGALSGWFADALKSVLTSLNLESFADFILSYIRKIAHYTLYACLGLSVSICVFTYSFRHIWLYIAIPLILCFVYACSDEIHQLFVEGREGKFTDVLIDTVGYATTVFLSYLVYFLAFIRKRNKQ